MSKSADEIMRGYRNSRVRTPQMVHYGMDVSDPDPSNWKAFGAEVEAQRQAEQAKSTPLLSKKNMGPAAAGDPSA